jgi:hypothetical protein
MENVLTVQPQDSNLPVIIYSQEQLDLLRKQVMPTCPEPDFKMLVARSQYRGQDYFKGDCHFISRKEKDYNTGDYREKWLIVSAIDYFRKVAHRVGEKYPGRKLNGRYEVNSYYYDKDGSEKPWHHVVAKFPPLPDIARAVIEAGGVTYIHEVSFLAYAQSKEYNGQKSLTGRWKLDPGGMITKCAEEGALRKAYPEDLAGVYGWEEMGEEDDPKKALPPNKLPPEERKPAPTAEQLREWNKTLKTPEAKAAAERSIKSAEKKENTTKTTIPAENVTVETIIKANEGDAAAIKAVDAIAAQPPAQAATLLHNAPSDAPAPSQGPAVPDADKPPEHFSDDKGLLWPSTYTGMCPDVATGEIKKDIAKNRLWHFFFYTEWARKAFGWKDGGDTKAQDTAKANYAAFWLWLMNTPKDAAGKVTITMANMQNMAKGYHKITGSVADLGKAITIWCQKTGRDLPAA